MTTLLPSPDRDMSARMHRNLEWIRLGTPYGVPVDLHAGFFLTAALLTCPVWRTLRLGDLLLAPAIIAILLGSLVVHELAHALAERRFHARPTLIEINLLGGLAHFERWARKTGESCAILFAGPLSNLILAAIGSLLLQLLQFRQNWDVIWNPAARGLDL